MFVRDITKSKQLWPNLNTALNDFLMYSSWHKKEFFWLVPALAGGNENSIQKAIISALADRDALLTLLSLLLSPGKAAKYHREHTGLQRSFHKGINELITAMS